MKAISTLMIAATLFVTPMFAGTVNNLPEITKVISLKELEVDLSEDFLNGSIQNLAVLCEEGSEFPVRYMASFGLVSLDFAPNLKIKFDQTCYFRVCGKKVYVSQDLINWEKPSLPMGKSKFLAGFSGSKSELLIKAEPRIEEDEDDDFDWDDE